MTRPASALDVLRRLGYSVGWSSSPMDAPSAMSGRAVVLDGTRRAEERWAAVELAAGEALDLSGRSGPDDDYGR